MAKTTAPTPSTPGRWIVSEFGPPAVLSWKEFDHVPIPSDNEALIRIIAAGIGAVDNMQRVGGYPDPRTSAPGFTPGYEFVGEIESLGPAASGTSLSIGDRVVSLCTVGGYATHTIIPVTELVKIPLTDDPIKVTALPLNYMTAYGMLKRSGVNLSSGSTVLVGSAAGGIGCAIAQLNAAFNMGLVLYGTCSPKNFDFVQSLGITPIDRHADNLPARVKELTKGKGVDVAFDAAGSEKSIRDSFAATIEGTGEVRAIGGMSKIAPGGTGLLAERFDTFAYLQKGVLPRAKFWMVTRDYYYTHRDIFREDFEGVLEAVREGKLSPLIGQLFGLGDAVKVNELLAHGAPFTGKMEFLVDSQLAESYKL